MVATWGLSAAPIRIKRQTVTILPQSGHAIFTIQFDRAPNFIGTDDNVYPRQADSFQYWINYDPTRSYFDNVFDPNVVIIRGEEIHVDGEIIIRDSVAFGSDPDPNSGGWGVVRGAVAYTLHNRTLVFAVPLELIDVGHADFSYFLESASYGLDATEIDDHARALPDRHPALMPLQSLQ